MSSANGTRTPRSCGSSKTFGLAESALLIATVAGERKQHAQNRNDDHARTSSAHCFQVDRRNTHQDTDDVGDEPGKPDHRAEGVEALLRLFAAAQISPRCPRCVNEHQNDSYYACDAMDSHAASSLCGHGTHHQCACCVAGKSDPKERYVFSCERAAASLSENSPGIEHECGADRDR